MEKNKVSIEDYRKFMQEIEKIERKYGIISVTNENIYTIISIFTNCDEEFLSGVYALALEEKRSTFANKIYKIIFLFKFSYILLNLIWNEELLCLFLILK